MSTGETITTRYWSGYGKSPRLYANAPDKATVAWMDLTTGDVTVETDDERLAARATAALQNWRDRKWTARAPHDVPAETSAPSPEVTPEVDTDVYVDLAEHVPGQLVRARADEEWEKEQRVGKVMARLVRLADAQTDERAWRKGAEGEEKIGAVLDRMAKHGWRTLHSIPVGENSDIDHLVVGPGGVVLVNTKHHPGAKVTITKFGVLINGGKTEHVKQAREQAKRAYGLLTAAGADVKRVIPCVAIYNGGLLAPDSKIASTPPGVMVVTHHNLGINLKRLDPVLSSADIERIYAVARRSTTWS